MPEKPSRYPADVAKAHLVKLIKHAGKETNRFLQIGATQQVRVRGSTAVIALCE
jgi:hypothetical protein